MTEVLGNPSQTVYDGFFQVRLVRTPRGIREHLVATDSVALMIYDRDLQSIILVDQVREAMFRPDNLGSRITEAVAGRFDVDLDVVALAIKEAKEEVDVDLRPDQVIVLNGGHPMAVSAGSTTERSYLAFAEVRSPQIGPERSSFGAASEGEDIVRRFVSIDDLRNGYCCEDVRVFALVQFLLCRLARGKKGA